MGKLERDLMRVGWQGHLSSQTWQSWQCRFSSLRVSFEQAKRGRRERPVEWGLVMTGFFYRYLLRHFVSTHPCLQDMYYIQQSALSTAPWCVTVSRSRTYASSYWAPPKPRPLAPSRREAKHTQSLTSLSQNAQTTMNVKVLPKR